MDTQHYAAYHALMEIATKENIPISNVIQSIEDAILNAYSGSFSQGNTAAISARANIPCKDTVPTAIELIAYISEIAFPEINSTRRLKRAAGSAL